MYQHPDMKPLDIISACRDTLYTSNALFTHNSSIQDRKSTCSDSSTNVTPIGYLSGYASYTINQVDYKVFGYL